MGEVPERTMVAGPAVAADYVHLRVVALLPAVDPDQDVLEHPGRVDIRLRDVGHESRGPGLRAHHQARSEHAASLTKAAV